MAVIGEDRAALVPLSQYGGKGRPGCLADMQKDRRAASSARFADKLSLPRHGVVHRCRLTIENVQPKRRGSVPLRRTNPPTQAGKFRIVATRVAHQ